MTAKSHATTWMAADRTTSDSEVVLAAARTEIVACLARRRAVHSYIAAGARHPSRSNPNPSKLFSSNINGFDIVPGREMFRIMQRLLKNKKITRKLTVRILHEGLILGTLALRFIPSDRKVDMMSLLSTIWAVDVDLFIIAATKKHKVAEVKSLRYSKTIINF